MDCEPYFPKRKQESPGECPKNVPHPRTGDFREVPHIYPTLVDLNSITIPSSSSRLCPLTTSILPVTLVILYLRLSRDMVGNQFISDDEKHVSHIRLLRTGGYGEVHEVRYIQRIH